MPYRIKDVPDNRLKLCGGKGASLVRLTRAGLPVPDGYILMPGEEISSIDRILPNLRGTYAVRSSALNEDGEAASFAGAYETYTNVRVKDIRKAVEAVRRSAENGRVKAYAKEQGVRTEDIAVVIQRFVKPEYAGVVFTCDPVTGSLSRMQGNYVKGEGELLVSGVSNAKEFTFDAWKYGYRGSREFAPYARTLYRYCRKIKNLWGCAVDIEWAVSGGKVYILQARPVTTVSRGREDLYELNGSCAGEFLLTRTNVGEIFGMPLSPVTYSIQNRISSMLMPNFIDNICGQAYLNVSVVASSLMALGLSEKTALKLIKDIVGKLPEGVTVPVYPLSGTEILKRMLHLIKPKKNDRRKGLSYTDTIMAKTERLRNRKQMRAFWDREVLPYINASLAEIVKGMNITGLFMARNKVEKMCGEDLAGRLLAGCTGVLDSMKPLLLLEELAEGRITKEEYIKQCGHRHSHEMELMMPFPYEDPDFPEGRIWEHLASGVNVHRMKKASEKEFRKALKEFDAKHPAKHNEIRRLLGKYARANRDRESVRNRGVRIFCVLRNYLLRAGKVLEIDNDGIFMLYIDEILALLAGDDKMREKIAPRRALYERYLSYPQFPNIICGRFDPESWMKDPARRSDYYVTGRSSVKVSDETVKGYPGAAGVVTGRVRVLTDVKEARELLEGEILVTNATNIGWTIHFPKAAAIVTDIGAPLSHAAIVAREFGIPAVVGCGNATTVLKTGDIVTVNGTAGTVDIEDTVKGKK